MTHGQRLKALRKKWGLSQRQLTQIFKQIKFRTLQDAEQDRTRLTSFSLLALELLEDDEIFAKKSGLKLTTKPPENRQTKPNKNKKDGK